LQMEESIDRVMAGPERRSRLITDSEKKIIAYHEAGHGLVSHLLPHAHPVHKITIIPRGRALGYTLTLPTEDRYLVTKAELTEEMSVILGGRAAEEVVFGDVTTGASDDIDKVTKIARSMVCEYGMSSLGPVQLGHKDDPVFLGRDMSSAPDYSDRVAADIDREIHALIDDAFERSKEMLRSHRKLLDRIVEVLIERETIAAAELEKIFKGIKIPSAERGRVLDEEPKRRRAPATRARRAPGKPKPGLSPA